jgi:hypothetical protein
MLQRHLQEAEEHILLGRHHIARQMHIVAKLERDGHNTNAARRLLATYGEMQEAHEADRDWIKKELIELDQKTN